MDSLIRYYNQFDEWGRLDREPLEYLINLHHIRRYLPHSGRILDNGAGPGKYSMYLAEQGYQVTLTDLTPRLVELAQQKATELNLDEQFDGFHMMDARNLNRLSDGQFDAVLMLGMNFMDSGIFNHDEEGRFTDAYYFDISEITPFMESHGFQTNKLIGSSSVAGGLTEEQWDYWKRQGEDAFGQMMELIMNESENPYILGTSSHLLYIGQKI
ncbi:class I SAM-dependent methyltransferase [Paenibacillus sp. D2_2]|uniref:class I SAM-dependent methyltransferase n=1 Tax=Paenibacillus sp. D2_2 TaxID=3073092 RepID=UPI00281506F4|nr:class I SAM-dependent methyltransferase [Paenibacillus sp. D2_2]WMT43531.1 class I SAM-dependent methyltransferase [Paenibacillus sp. D2_2]